LSYFALLIFFSCFFLSTLCFC